MTNDPFTTPIKSPLRYPGGKGCFFSYFLEAIKLNDLRGGKYFEPFAGGAAVGLGLLSVNIVTEIFINDADYHIYSFWFSVLNENNRFVETILCSEISINAWTKQKEIYNAPEKYSVFEVGFSAFYLNRCNRSGILAGAGPIGGYHQTGKWRMDARFNQLDLASRIRNIGKLKDAIHIGNMDAIDFLKRYLPRGKGRDKSFVYADPPYVSAGHRLYLSQYSSGDHKRLALYLLKQTRLNWLATYDDTPLIRRLYSPCQRWLFTLGYSLQSKQRGNELLLAPERLHLPEKDKCTGNRWNIVERL
ncbi:MAG: DNA adenine methylase [Janthinobacterium lividum]